MSKTDVLVNKGYITQNWAEVIEEPLIYFYEKIVPEINKSEKRVYPENKDTFKAFKLCPYKDLKVVILAQDPYFNAQEANGLAFDVPIGTKIPKSLSMILRELAEDTGYYWEDKRITDESYLTRLPPQGVLLLNTALTVEHKSPLSHAEFWKPFTDSVIEKINQKDNIVWILFGNHAKFYKHLITNPTHRIVEGCHPAARGKHNTFLGGKYFSKCNSYLEEMGHKPINW